MHKTGNPFYAGILAAGILFTVTVCSYGVMHLQQLQAVSQGDASATSHMLTDLLQRRGEMILAAELVVLAAAALAAVVWERRRGRRT